MRMTQIEYDPEVKILGIHLGNKKTVNCVEQDGCVFDYDADGNIVYIEVFDVSPSIIESLLKSN